MPNLTPYLTPHKYGKPVLVGSGKPGAFDEQAVDGTMVFRHNDRFYMLYVGYDGIGYQSALATSDDLLNWEHHAIILKRNDSDHWDAHNIAAGWIMRDNDLRGVGKLKKWDGKYWMSYHAYPNPGYEDGPGRMGIAWTEDENLLEWHRHPEPILLPEEGGEWEQGGLYKDCLLEHDGTFYLFYNAKNKKKRWNEQIGFATSADMINWTRYEGNPVLPVSAESWDLGFVANPCVLRDGDQWIMYYYGYDYKVASEGIAFSKDLIHWEKHPDPIMTVEEPPAIDTIYAHKPAIITHNGVLYHFYTACRRWREGDPTKNFGYEFRTISVAASQDIF